MQMKDLNIPPRNDDDLKDRHINEDEEDDISEYKSLLEGD